MPRRWNSSPTCRRTTATSVELAVGLPTIPAQRFAYALFDAGEIRSPTSSDPAHPQTAKFSRGQQPHDGLATPDGRYYIAGPVRRGRFGLLDTWRPEAGARRSSPATPAAEKPPVFKMPICAAGRLPEARLSAGHRRHEVLVVDTRSWKKSAASRERPAGVRDGGPDGREVWVNFAFPDNGWVQVIDTPRHRVQTLAAGQSRAAHEFTPRGDGISFRRDDDKVAVYDTATLLKTLDAKSRAAFSSPPRPSNRVLDERLHPIELRPAQRLPARLSAVAEPLCRIGDDLASPGRGSRPRPRSERGARVSRVSEQYSLRRRIGVSTLAAAVAGATARRRGGQRSRPPEVNHNYRARATATSGSSPRRRRGRHRQRPDAIAADSGPCRSASLPLVELPYRSGLRSPGRGKS